MGEREGDRQKLPVRWRLFGALLAAADDPDAKGVAAYAPGVAVGVQQRLPRTPAVFPQKRRWRLSALRDREAPFAEDPSALVWVPNHLSARELH